MFVDLFGVGCFLKRTNAGQRGRHSSVAQRFRHDGQVRAGPQADALWTGEKETELSNKYSKYLKEDVTHCSPNDFKKPVFIWCDSIWRWVSLHFILLYGRAGSDFFRRGEPLSAIKGKFHGGTTSFTYYVYFYDNSKIFFSTLTIYLPNQLGNDQWCFGWKIQLAFL